MKFSFQNSLKDGKYFVSISAEGLSPDEAEQMEKFGVPQISISPKTTEYNYRTVTSLPIVKFAHVFEFTTKEQAEAFSDSMKERIRTALQDLRRKNDDFSKKDELNF